MNSIELSPNLFYSFWYLAPLVVMCSQVYWTGLIFSSICCKIIQLTIITVVPRLLQPRLLQNLAFCNGYWGIEL